MQDLRRLVALRAFADRGTIAAAAEALGYSPAAVSQQLSALERELGVKLLERTARSANLTQAGIALVASVPDVLSAVEKARSGALAAARSVAGQVTVSTIPTATVVVAPALAEFVSQGTEVKVTLRQASPSRALRQLRAHELDVAVIDAWEPMPKDDEIHLSLLARDPLVLAMPGDRPAAEPTRGITLADVAAAAAGRTWLCAPSDEPSRAVSDEILRRSGATPASTWEVEGLAAIGQLVGKGVGVAILPKLALVGRPEGSIIEHPLRPPRHRKLYVAVRRSGREHPLTRTTAALIRTAFH